MLAKFLRILALTIVVALPHSASAQDTQTLNFLAAQQGYTPGEVEALIGGRSTGGDATSAGIPTAQNADSSNLSDIKENPNLLTQSIGSAPNEGSVVQRYYQFLTGKTLEIYGAQEFSQQQDNQLLFFNTMGKNYRVAPGDVLRLTIRGLWQSDITLQIGRDGNLVIPDLAPLAVSGQTIAEIEEGLLQTLLYDDASASVFVSLETARLVTVQVSGLVNAPRTLAVPAYTPLSRVLAYAGGVKPTGSLRTIVLRDRDGTTSEVDFYDFLRSPLGANDPLVTDASRIFVPSQGPTVAAVGFVARPGIYELPAGVSEVSIREILELSGTKILPPGLAIEALYFDANGISQTRDLSPSDTILPGEVLNLRFVQTRLQDAVTVFGAVLDEYSMATSSSISIRDLLKSGSTLKADARLDFAMIIDREGAARAINLSDALETPSAVVPKGAALVVFDHASYRNLVNADVNRSSDPLVSAISRAEVAEIYLNGDRLALVAPDETRTFAEHLRPYYRPTPDTYLDLAIIESAQGAPRAMSLRTLLQNDANFAFSSGLKVHLFETKYLNDFVRRLGTQEVSGDVAALSMQQGKEASLARLLADAEVVRVTINGRLRAVLPSINSQSIADVLDVLGIVQAPETLSDFVELQSLSRTWMPQSQGFSLRNDYSAALPQATSINFWSKDELPILSTRQGEEETQRLRETGVLIYLDYEPTIFVATSAFAGDTLVREVISPRVYPLFAIRKSFDAVTHTWSSATGQPQNFFSSESMRPTAGDELFLFTTDFVRELLRSNVSASGAMSATVSVEGESQTANGLETQIAEDLQARSRAADEVRGTQAFDSDVKILIASARYIGGAVADPGLYPISGSTTLGALLSVSGGLLDTADSSSIRLNAYEQIGGAIRRGNTLKLNANEPAALATRLSGNFSCEVPFLINEAATGFVSLNGEVMRPGDYVISREDTLHDVITRAGGLSPVAYPLGAVFTRESLVGSEREINGRLAAQLEQTVLSIAETKAEGAADQINAVLGYARQLRMQDAVGRMSVNVAYANPSAPVYLQDGDALFIPKRPSHVSVVGAVNSNTAAIYEPTKMLAAYLAAAGGTTRVADQRGIYMILPNGESTPVDGATPIPPGAAIVVPPKTDRLSALGLSDLVSRVMGNIATSVLAINNVR